MLNNITMYRLMLYSLVLLIIIGCFIQKPFYLLITVLILVTSCWSFNKIFSKIFKVDTNLESVYITALILALIINPITSVLDLGFSIFVSFLAISSKYILVFNKKHIFNPAAVAISISALFFGKYASWWSDNSLMSPFILVLGLLIVKKIKRWSLFLSFVLTTVVLTGHWPLLFFTFIMLTEPLTTPPTRNGQIFYGMIVGIAYLFLLPEYALLLGNIFSFIVSPKQRLILKLKEKIKLSENIYDFVFDGGELNYKPGQYLEWTLSHKNPDSRGNRRYFTLASSPNEDLRIGVKFNLISSSFKKALLALNPGDIITASQLGGDFVLPKDSKIKLAFIAGGIGITPFRSMIQSEKRDVVLLYSNKNNSEAVYGDVLNKVKTYYIETEKEGHINAEMIKKEIPDYKERIFYLSGPPNMVDSFKKILGNLGVSIFKIKTDYFPGY